VPRYRLTIAYDGTDFCGWQKQEPPHGASVDPAKIMATAPSAEQIPAGPVPGPRLILRTVQEVVERAVREVVREPIELVGASRTDAGVHARAQVGAFTCSGESPERKLGDDAAPPVITPPPAPPEPGTPAAPSPRARSGWPASRGLVPLVRAINSRLPPDILVVDAQLAPADFNPISGAVAKAYSYTLHVSPHRPLWDRHFVQHVWVPLELSPMQEAAAHLVGEHDFAAFAAAGHGRQSTIRTVYECRVIEHPAHASEPPDTTLPTRRLRIEIAGSGFLWNMVRIIAGTLVDVGRGRLSPDHIIRALESGDRRQAGPTLPPTGLCLEWVRY
jgi:tRNA pseudouridine38-40 synthase